MNSLVTCVALKQYIIVYFKDYKTNYIYKIVI